MDENRKTDIRRIKTETDAILINLFSNKGIEGLWELFSLETGAPGWRPVNTESISEFNEWLIKNEPGETDAGGFDTT